MKPSKDIRQEFIRFFESKDHTVVRSAPVIPFDDPTLLFTNAGMNQFKNIFLDIKKPDTLRAVDSQKCIRAGGKHNDLEEVGADGYHHTFFEMLGNWSFGDYYKKEAIIWAWELLTEVWKLPKDKLYATAYKDDKEAFDLWKSETDIDPDKVLYYGDKDNFWEMGDVGPCGPCSEIHIDRGEEFCNLKDDPNHNCIVNGDCHRYIELWNLVFIQYFRDEEGKLNPLKNKFVDTGAGFERICQVLQNKDSNYETDLFQPIIQEISRISGVDYQPDEKGTIHRIIADHIRALTFAIADGGMPSNEGRGYVLRRILRRAARNGRLLNLKKPFLHELVDKVIEVMGHHYSEIKEKKSHIKLIIKAEEERFNLTLDKGLSKFEEIVEKLDGKLLTGKDAFVLYDTYGFPLDLTRILANEKGLKVDEDSFHLEMEAQRERARKSAKFVMKTDNVEWIELKDSDNTEFYGYDTDILNCQILKYTIDDNNQVQIILDQTPFYAEQGGQIADKGKIYNDECEIIVKNVKKVNDLYIHYGILKNGEINDQDYTAEIDAEYRKKIARNHTATHLLHAALRKVLGDHVQQKGSLVTADSLRFDFTHFQHMSEREIELAEKLVNEQIRLCSEVVTEVKDIDTAKKEGATALFGEKYEDDVRVVSVDNFSKELCGGTHLENSGEIGMFKIKMESSIAAGIRRIEAITGTNTEEFVYNFQRKLKDLTTMLGVPEKTVMDKISKLLDEKKELEAEVADLRMTLSGQVINEILQAGKIDEINGIKVVAAKVSAKTTDELRSYGDRVTSKIKSGIGVLIAEVKGKVSILTVVTKDLTKTYKAGKIVNEVAQIVGGRGGGRPDMAMAGGKDVTKIDEAISKVKGIIEGM